MAACFCGWVLCWPGGRPPQTGPQGPRSQRGLCPPNCAPWPGLRRVHSEAGAGGGPQAGPLKGSWSPISLHMAGLWDYCFLDGAQKAVQRPSSVADGNVSRHRRCREMSLTARCTFLGLTDFLSGMSFRRGAKSLQGGGEGCRFAPGTQGIVTRFALPPSASTERRLCCVAWNSGCEHVPAGGERAWGVASRAYDPATHVDAPHCAGPSASPRQRVSRPATPRNRILPTTERICWRRPSQPSAGSDRVQLRPVGPTRPSACCIKFY